MRSLPKSIGLPNIIVCAALSLAVCMAHPAKATPRADAQYIANVSLKIAGADQVQNLVRQIMARKLADELKGLGVKVKDHKRLARILPDAALPDIGDPKGRIVDLLLRTQEPEVLAQVASAMREKAHVLDNQQDEAAQTAETLSLEDWEAQTLPKVEEVGAQLQVILPVIMLQVRLSQELSAQIQSAPLDPKADRFADIYQHDGIFEFPNRVVWQSFRNLGATARAGSTPGASVRVNRLVTVTRP